MIGEDAVERARAVRIENEIERRGIKLKGRVDRCGPCPICGGTDRFAIHIEKQVFNCRGCGAKGDVISLVQHLDGCGFIEAVEKLSGMRTEKQQSSGDILGHMANQAKTINGSYCEDRHNLFNDEHLIRQGYENKSIYDYKDHDGSVLYQVLRYEHPIREKTFKQRRSDGNGCWYADAGYRKVLYRLPDIKQAVHNVIFICEGEKDADRLASLGFLATTVAGGHWSQEAIESLRGYECLILEDNDEAGRKKSLEVANSLYGVAESVRIVRLPGLPHKGDVSDWLNAGGDHNNLLGIASLSPEWKPDEKKDKDATVLRHTIKFVDFTTLLTEEIIEEPDYIEPAFAGPGNFILIAGPPKSQKSFFLQEILVACATGKPFLFNRFTVPSPLRVFCLQAEMNRKLLRKRARSLTLLSANDKEFLSRNLIISERFNMVLNNDGVSIAISTIREAFPLDPPDILAFDPLANIFDGENENDNTQIMKFLRERIEIIRSKINPLACVFLVHHSTKKTIEDMARDPFVAIRGGGALRGYYDSAVVIYKKSEESKHRMVHFELRGGESPEPAEVELINGRFQEASLLGDINIDMARLILGAIESAWNDGNPLSLIPQTRSEGRYAPRELGVKFNVASGAVKAIIEEWLTNKIVCVHIVDKHTKLRGLKVIGSI